MHVGPEGVRHDAGIQDPARHVEAEVRAVPDVDPESARHRLLHHRMQAPGSVDEPARVTGERVGQDVARPQELDHLGEHRVGVRRPADPLGQRPELAEVNVQGEPGVPTDPGAEPEHLQPPARDAADLRVGLDAPDQIRVLPRGADSRPDVDAVRPVQGRVVVPLQAPDEVGGEERVDAARRGLDHELAEPGQGHAARATLVDQRGDARADSDHVGLETESPGDVLVDVGVRVDEAGQDQSVMDVDDLGRRRPGEVCRHRGDPAVPHGDVERAVDPAGRIDDPAPAKQEIVLRHASAPPVWHGLYATRVRDRNAAVAGVVMASPLRRTRAGRAKWTNQQALDWKPRQPAVGAPCSASRLRRRPTGPGPPPTPSRCSSG